MQYKRFATPFAWLLRSLLDLAGKERISAKREKQA